MNSDKRPNILLITTDQQRFDTLHAFGNKHIFTPHLNWLADTGIAFTRCYSDSPICMPARATIMTGRHGYTTGLVGNSGAIRPMAEHPTLPGILTLAGYQTRAQGKMHFEPMRAHYGFETMELPMDYYRERGRNQRDGMPKDHGVGENEIEPVISTVPESESLTQWTVKRSIDFLETRDETKPFFLWTSFTKPHPPFDPCENYWRLYQNRDVPDRLLGDWSASLADMPQGYLASTYTLNSAWRMTDDMRRDVVRAYYACITQIDYALGLLFARMREMDLLENTWIVFTADHGDMLGDHRLGAKSVFLEGSAHIPLIIRPPHGSWVRHDLSGVCCDTRVDLADILPTVLACTGVPAPEGIDGTNLMPFAESCPQPANRMFDASGDTAAAATTETNAASKTIPDRIFYGNCEHRYLCVMDGMMKYQWTRLGGAELLFDLASDPGECRNLAADPAHAYTLARLRQLLVDKGTSLEWPFVKDGRLVPDPAPKGPNDFTRWPGLHSLTVPTDVLH